MISVSIGRAKCNKGQRIESPGVIASWVWRLSNRSWHRYRIRVSGTRLPVGRDGKALAESYPDIQSLYDEASSVLGYDIAALCFEGPAERLNLTEFTQPALLVSSIAAFRALESLNITPAAVAGHSLGEYSALVAAGGLSFRDAVGIVQKRGKYMAEAVPSGTGLVAALIGLTREVVKDVCREASSVGVVAAANFNSPGQVVIAGEKAAVERAIELAKAKGCKKAIPLPVSVPVHTPLMQKAADRLAGDLAAIAWSDLKMPLINNAEAKPLTKGSEIQASLDPAASFVRAVGRFREGHGGDGREDVRRSRARRRTDWFD